MEQLRVRAVKPDRGVLCEITEGHHRGKRIYMQPDPGNLQVGDLFEAEIRRYEVSGNVRTRVFNIS